MTQTNSFKDINYIRQSRVQKLNQRERKQSKSVVQENIQLKKQNQLLKKEIENFNTKLDNELIKHFSEQNKKGIKSKRQDVQNMELKNAYKQCDIYKKEAHFYKRKLAMLEQREKSQEFGQYKKSSLQRQNAKLREEMNYMIKINKRQEKGLQEAGIKGFISNSKETERLHDEIRRLKRQVQCLQKDNSSKASESRAQYHKFSTLIPRRQNFYNPSRQRIRSQAGEHNQGSQVNALRERIEKDQVRLKVVKQERDKLREQVHQYKQQLNEKNKEINSLKEKINSLRRNNQLLQSQLQSKKAHNQSSNNSDAKISRKQRIEPYARRWSISKLEAKTPQKPTVKKDKHNQENIFKWSHEAFASKMKELNLVIHPKGHIQDIHAKYEHGQPKLYKSIRNQSYQSLVCRQGQFIQHLSGCFCDGFLQCLTVLTSDKRIQTFGNAEFIQLNEGGQKFEFQLQSDSMYGALFGETSEEGVKKLSCKMVKI